MQEPSFHFYITLVAVSIAMAIAGLYLINNFRNILRRQIRNEVIRKNVVVWLIVFSFFIAMCPMNAQIFSIIIRKGVLHAFLGEAISATVNVLFVFNIVRVLSNSAYLKSLSFRKQRMLILFVLILSTIIFNSPLDFLVYGFTTKYLKYSILWSFYLGSVTGLVYVLMTFLQAERVRKLQEKELELSKLTGLKTKAELDALHSKVNPHFLYNALNSIADLSITDGKKARKMTIALADLFRYSINYSQNNYTTVNEEVAMTEVYLQIEKIRFEDQLTYTVNVDPELGYYLVPRFILQPLAENAVKHGLKITGQMTEILLEVKKENDGLVMHISDNGPAFPDELVPGYGVKSVFDKMDLLFPEEYEIHFTNTPHKQVSIHLHKLMKHEPAI